MKAVASSITWLSICKFSFIWNHTRYNSLSQSTSTLPEQTQAARAAHCNRRGRRGPGRLGPTPFAPECRGLHHRSCGFLPVTESNRDCWWKTAQVKKKKRSSTSNPKISSMDWSASSGVVEVLDIWGIGSLVERKKRSPHHPAGQREKHSQPSQHTAPPLLPRKDFVDVLSKLLLE